MNETDKQTAPADEGDAYAVDFEDRGKIIAETLFWAAEAGKPLTLTIDGREMAVMVPRPAKAYVVAGGEFVFAVRTSEASARKWAEESATVPRGVTEHQWTPARPDGRLIHRFKDPRTNRWNKSGFIVTEQDMED